MELVALRGSMLKSQDQLNTDLISLTALLLETHKSECWNYNCNVVVTEISV